MGFSSLGVFSHRNPPLVFHRSGAVALWSSSTWIVPETLRHVWWFLFYAWRSDCRSIISHRLLCVCCLLNLRAIYGLGFEKWGCCTSTLSPASLFFSISLATLPVAGVEFPHFAIILMYAFSAFRLTTDTGFAHYRAVCSAVLKFDINSASYNYMI